MSAAELNKVVEVMRMVQADCEKEGLSIDGKPFDAITVAIQFGNLLAEVSAVANAVERIAAALVSAADTEQGQA